MIFVGYETGTKGYRVYDPVTKRLHISRDVIFEESKAWEWNNEAQADRVASTFDVEFYTVAGQGTITEFEGAEELTDPTLPDQGSPSQVQWSINPSSSAGSNQSTPPGSPPAQAIEFATPPTGNTMDSEGVPMRFRTIENINDTTDEVHDFEYSGVCYFVAEEPRSVDEALDEQCWREAMTAEMNSIQANGT
jgi:hypothetical protein